MISFIDSSKIIQIEDKLNKLIDYTKGMYSFSEYIDN